MEMIDNGNITAKFDAVTKFPAIYSYDIFSVVEVLRYKQNRLDVVQDL